jgi:hypothetical protein
MYQIDLMTIPVYRIQRETYYEQRNVFTEKKIFGGSDAEFKRKYCEDNPEYLRSYKDAIHTNYGGAWEYNEIIGFIKLHILGSQIRGEYCQDDKRRFVKSRSKQFKYVTHKLAPENSFYKGATNGEIYQTICLYVDDCRKELKGRYIDDSNLKNVGKYVDWNSLIKGV